MALVILYVVFFYEMYGNSAWFIQLHAHYYTELHTVHTYKASVKPKILCAH